MGDFKQGRRVIFRGLTSASKDMYRAGWYAVKKGDWGILFRLDGWSARLVSRFSFYEDEEEVLFPPGARFIVVDEAKKKSFDYDVSESGAWEEHWFMEIRLVQESNERAFLA